MPFIQKFFTGYQGYDNGETRTGELNRLWYDSNTNTIRIGDGTPGGKLVSGGGSGSNLPADSIGYLHNDGAGNLDWSATTADLGNLVINGTDLQSISGTQTNKDIVLNPNGSGWVSVPKLKIPVGSLIEGTDEIVDIIEPLELDSVIAYSDGDALPANTYGDNPACPAPWIVYKFYTTPDPALQIDDLVAGVGIPASPPCTVRWVGSGAYEKYILVDNHTYTGYPAPIPTFGSIVYINRSATHPSLSIQTTSTTDISLDVGEGGNIVVHGSIIPYTENVFSLGSPIKRFSDLWLGGYAFMLDEALNTHWQLHADNGVFYIQGGTGIEVGEFVLSDNILKIQDTTRDIIIGDLSATGSVVFNREVKVQTTSGFESFNVSREGTTTITVPTTLDTTKAALNIIGSTDGSQQARNFSGTLLQLTAQPNSPARFTMDSYGTGTYGSIAARTARGTVNNPSQIKANDTIMRLSGSAWGITQTTIQNFGSTGYVSKVAAGSGKYNITFNIVQQETQPPLTSDVFGTTYEVDQNSNVNYNKSGLICVASSTTSITLQYPSDPGVFDLVVTTIESTGSFLSGLCRINLTANEDFTTSGAGTKVVFQTTPNNTTTISTSATIDDTGIVLTGTTNSSNGITFRDGTRQTTAAVGLPTQQNNANKYLKTDGSTASWQTIPTGIQYRGLWNASTNKTAASVTLADGTGTGGDEYSVTTAGTVDFGHGSITFYQGDFVIYNGDTSRWERIPGAVSGVQSIQFDGNTPYTSANIQVVSDDIVNTISSGAIANVKLEHDSITINTSTGLTGGGSIALGNITGLTLTNTGVTSITGSNHISTSSSTGSVTVTSDATILDTANTIALRDSIGGLAAKDFTATATTSVSSNHGAFNLGNLSYSDTGILANFSTSEIYYNQLLIQNTRNTQTASVNFIVSNNAGTANSYYGEFGMNATAWDGTGFSKSGAVYLNSESTDLIIGTTAPKSIEFLTNDTLAASIDSSGVATFVNTISGSISGNAGTANSVNHSLTAGTGITFSSGTTYNGSAAITINATQYTLPAATDTTLGGVIIPPVATSAISNSSGTISVPHASSSQLGVIRIGTGLSIDGNGIVSTSGVQASVRQAGTISSLTIDFSTDDVVQCTASGALSISLQNYVAGKIVRVMILQPAKNNITHGLQATNVNVGALILASTVQANTPNTVFITYTCVAPSQAGTFAQIIY